MSDPKVSVYPTKLRGEQVWVVSWTQQGARRPRKYFATRPKAEAAAAQKRREFERLGTELLGLTDRERIDLASVMIEIRDAGLSMREVWDGYKASGKVSASKALGAAIEALVSAKRSLGRRPSYIAGLTYTLGRFACGREETPVGQITASMCEEWLTEAAKASSVRAAYQSRLSTLFGWCVQQGWAATNPTDRLGRVSVDQKAPAILTPDQVDAALAWVDEWPDFRAYLVLGLFCGIRPDELARLQWSQVDLGRGLVTIDAATSKVRRRRIVPIGARALELLYSGAVVQWCSGPIFPGSTITLRRRRRALAAALKIKWSNDLLRHTAASYLMARDRDAGKVADGLGNSPGVLLTRYRELVGPEDSARFWGA